MNIVEEAAVECPCCGEPIELLIDLSIEDQKYTEDCPVCCRPFIVQAVTGGSGLLQLRVDSEDD